jgi:hypothetical protein
MRPILFSGGGAPADARRFSQRWLDPSTQFRICGSCRKSAATMAQPIRPSCCDAGRRGRSQSPSFDERRRPETLRTAIATELLVQADGLVGGSDAVLVIDDTEIPKKGAHSVGVAAQYASAARGLPKAGSRSSMGAAWPRSAIAHKFAGHSAPTDDGRVKASMRGIWGRAPEKTVSRPRHSFDGTRGRRTTLRAYVTAFAADRLPWRLLALGAHAASRRALGPCVLTRDLAESTKMGMRDIRLPANIRAGLELM